MRSYVGSTEVDSTDLCRIIANVTISACGEKDEWLKTQYLFIIIVNII